VHDRRARRLEIDQLQYLRLCQLDRAYVFDETPHALSLLRSRRRGAQRFVTLQFRRERVVRLRVSRHRAGFTRAFAQQVQGFEVGEQPAREGDDAHVVVVVSSPRPRPRAPESRTDDDDDDVGWLVAFSLLETLYEYTVWIHQQKAFSAALATPDADAIRIARRKSRARRVVVFVVVVVVSQSMSSSRAASLRREFSRWSVEQLRDYLEARDVDVTSLRTVSARVEACVASELAEDDDDDAGDRRGGDGDDEVDPLDAFMAGLDDARATTQPQSREETTQPQSRGRDAEDDEGFERMVMMMDARSKPVPGRGRRSGGRGCGGREEDADVYAAAAAAVAKEDGDGNDRRREGIETMTKVDHATVSYEAFKRQTYVAPKDLAGLTADEVRLRREALDVRVEGCDLAPVTRFGQGGALDVDTLKALKRLNFETPTGIQAQSLPVIMSGRDALAVAKTGSGKTLAFLLPALAQISRQRRAEKFEGPIALILAPTRELTMQISNEAAKLCKNSSVRTSAIFGGVGKTEQFKHLRNGVELLIGTPGRLIDIFTMKNAPTLRRVTYLALDEADRMLDMGFERAVRSISQAVRPDRQCVMFSATMPARVKRLVRDVLSNDYATITVGQVGVANEDVRQIVQVFGDDAMRAEWFFSRLNEFIDQGQVLVFVNHKSSVEELTLDLARRGIKTVGLHGDMDQAERLDVMKSFKAELSHVLVATDVAARGLDIESIKTVINYHAARDMSTHVHRVGRTGRSGALDGCAYTLLTPRDSGKFAQQLERNLSDAGQQVPLDLKALARGTYKRPREGNEGAGAYERFGRGKIGGRGVGFVGEPLRREQSFGGGRGRGTPAATPSADFTAVPPPLVPPSAPPPPPPGMVNAMVAQARARAEEIAKQFAPPNPPNPPPPPAQQNTAANAAVAAARAIAERLAAQDPNK